MYLRFTGNQTQAVTIWIYDDAMLELDEDFFVNLVLVPSGLDVLLNFSRVRVVIADDDSKLSITHSSITVIRLASN